MEDTAPRQWSLACSPSSNRVQDEVYDARGLEVEERFFGMDEAMVPMDNGEVGRAFTHNASSRRVERRMLGDPLNTPCVRTYDEESEPERQCVEGSP